MPVGAAMAPDLDLAELEGLAYRCLEDCGFCCTFTAEVAPPELARLKARLPSLPVVRTGETTLLGLQGGCGACTLLKDRKCTVYDDRPAHCRYFPFHVYFGRRPEAYVNRSCRGVEARPGGSLRATFSEQVLGTVAPFRLRKQAEKALAVHAAFERNAKDAGAWGDVDAELARLVAAGPAWFHPDTWPVDVPDPEAAGAPAEAWRTALQPFALEDPVNRPYLVDRGLRWLGFRAGPGGLVAETLGEDGSFQPVRDLGPFDAWPALPPEVRDALATHLAWLTQRDLFAGSVFSLVDGTDYQASVADAARVRVADTAADLAVRAEILHRMGLPWDQVPGEVERFYDSAFLDVETIGGWL
jgi:Fe-S-cluster containining protein